MSAEKILQSRHDEFLGVESLLKPEARIVYETLFNMRHAGRVIDLILHEARDFLARSPAPEEAAARVRHCLELAVMSAWVNYRGGEQSRSLEIEAGWDDERLVISVAGFVDDGLGGLVPSLGAPAGAPSARIARY